MRYATRGLRALLATALLLAPGCNLVAGLGDFNVTGGGGHGGTPTTDGGLGGQGGAIGCGTCPDPIDDCKVAVCNGAVCGATDAADGSEARNQATGDCKKKICMAGAAMDVNDDTDPPELAGDCKIHTCVSGGVVVSLETSGSKCGTQGDLLCDGNGVCFGCAKPEDCVDLGACQKPTCDATACGSAIDPTDIAVDTNDCTEDLCTGPVPNHPSKPAGTPCADGARVCDASGSCLGAPCGAQSACPSGAVCVDGVCCASACDKPCEACSTAAKGGVAPDGLCGPVAVGLDPTSECPDPQVCDGTIGSTSCKAPNGAACSDGSGCASALCADGVCCDAACSGVCQSCNLPGSKGTCTKIADGQDPESECAGAVTCNGTGACGSLFGDGTSCANGPECQSGICVDGVCCNTSCTGACRACDLPATKGVCTNIAANTDPGDAECPGPAQSCDGAGACKASTGQPCSTPFNCVSGQCADGVCCATTCSGACQSCNLPGSVGACAYVPSGQDPTNECPGSATCDGLGTCASLPIGTLCTQNSECQTSFCVDGRCCDSACSGVCMACSAMKTSQLNGVCAGVVNNTDPDNECLVQPQPTCGTDGYCDGSGACGKYAAGTFSNPTSYFNGFSIQPASLGDLNGDGKLDIVVSHSNGLTVLFNNGNGSFGNPTPGFNLSNARTASLGDLNGDGKLDIVVAYSNGLAVVLNNGNGTFGNPTPGFNGSGMEPAALGDLNGDGKLDIVVSYSNGLAVVLNNGNGTFGNPIPYASVSNAQTASLGDLNGDGKLDIVVAYNGGLAILLNNGNGTFGVPAPGFNGSGIQPASLGDLNGDGKLDIVVAYSNGLAVVLNNGNGTFGIPTPYANVSNAQKASLGDLNGDGKLDIVVAYNNGLAILLNNGNGTFGVPAPGFNGSSIQPASLGDLNGDGKLDIVVAYSNGLAGVLNNGNGTFGVPAPYASVSNAQKASLGDLNGDGNPDIVVAHSIGMSVLLNSCL